MPLHGQIVVARMVCQWCVSGLSVCQSAWSVSALSVLCRGLSGWSVGAVSVVCQWSVVISLCQKPLPPLASLEWAELSGTLRSEGVALADRSTLRRLARRPSWTENHRVSAHVARGALELGLLRAGRADHLDENEGHHVPRVWLLGLHPGEVCKKSRKISHPASIPRRAGNSG